MRRVLPSCLALLVAACASAPARSTPAVARPPGLGLTVLLVIDQLRADMPVRLLSRLPRDGFRRLYDEGVVYDNASYAHSATETAVGHATLSTGALPRDHGIVANEWVEARSARERGSAERGARVYAVDDVANELLGAHGPGKSPVRLLAESVGEVLSRERPEALVRSVSEKDRSAILLAGRAGVAYWLDDGAGSFVTSRFYAERLAPWVEAFAASRPLERYRTRTWELFARPSSYAAAEDRPDRRGCELLGCAFPHSPGTGRGEHFIHALRTTPFSDELALSFVEMLLAREPVGQDAVPDLLALSLSATDYVGHAFGPESREAEDNLLRLDRTLAALFALLDRRVGSGRYVVVLSSDHGACESPEFFRARGEDAGRVDVSALKRAVDAGLRARFGMGVELVADFVNPSLVLHEQRIASQSLDLPEVERAAAALALEVPGVYAAYARSDLVAGTTPAGPFKTRLEQSTHPERSGHVYIVPKEHWLLATSPEKLTAMHGTPWPYDAQVPIVVWGTGVHAQHVARAVDPRDVAPTLARLLRVPAPRLSTGQALVEALP